MRKFLGRLHQRLFNLLIVFLPVQLGKHFWPNWTIVKGIRIDYLSPTFYFTDLLVLGTLISWGASLWVKLKAKKAKVKTTTKKSKLLFFLVVFCLLNIFSAQNKLAAFLKGLKLAELFLLAFYIKNNLTIGQFASRREFRFCETNWTILFSFTIIYSSLIAWAQFLKQSSIGGFFWWLGERTFTAATPGIAQVVLNGRLFLRPYATFPHPNVLGGYLAITTPLLIANLKLIDTNCELRLKNIFNLLAVFLGIATLFITFSRTVWVVGGAGIIFSLMLLGFRRERGVRGRRGLLIFTLSLCFITLLLFGKERLGQLRLDSESIKLRQELNQLAIQMIKAYPLTGVGLGNFIPSLPQFKKGLSFGKLQPAHNIYLLVGAETGLIGLGIFGWLIWLGYKKLFQKNIKTLKHKNKKLLITNYLITLSAILALSLFDHYFFTLQQTQLLFAIVLGTVLGLE